MGNDFEMVIGDWVKIIHIIAVISWMAGLLYLPRLFVYHAELAKQTGHEHSHTMLMIMERRLLRYIMNPALLVVWASGLALAHHHGYFSQGWLHTKLTLVIVMTIVHMRLAWHRRQFAEQSNRHSARYFRILNEVPTVLMVGIVIIVILKPF